MRMAPSRSKSKKVTGRKKQGKKTVTAQRFDFRRPIKFRREHVRILELINETWCRHFSTVLSTRLRTSCQISLESVEQASYSEFIATIPNPTFMAIIAMQPLNGAALFHFPIPVGLAAIERLLGGAGTESQPPRALSDLESALMNDLIQRCLEELPYAFEQLISGLQPRVISVESNPQFAQICAGSDMAIIITYEVQIGFEQEKPTLCIPFTLLQPALESHISQKTFAETNTTDIEEAKRHLRDRMREPDVQVSAQFNSVSLSAKDIYSIRPGDLLTLGHSIHHPLTLVVDDIPCCYVVGGRKGKKVAVQVVGDAWLPEKTGGENDK